MKFKPYIPVVSMEGQTNIHDIFERCYIDEVDSWSDKAVDIMSVWLKYNSDHKDAATLTELLEKRSANVSK